MGSKEKGKCCNCIDVSGDDCPCGVMEKKVCDNSEVRLRLEEESSELSMDLARCWEIEQEGPQITDVQGHLGTKLEFWEKILEAPPPIIECIKENYLDHSPSIDVAEASEQ